MKYKAMSRWLGQNISLILLSLVLAFFFWALAMEAEDPAQEGPFSTSIPLDTRGLSEDMVAYGMENVRVRVELKAPQSVWQNLSPDNIDAYIDLTNVNTGTLTLPVQVAIEVDPVQVLKVTPAEVALDVELIVEKQVTVTVKSEGMPIFGYKAGEPEVAPRMVRVRGPASWVSKVTQAQVVVSVAGQQSDVGSDYTPVLLDVNDNAVSHVEVVPRTVTVNVPVDQLGYIRDLAVTVGLEGQPAPGYRVANLVVNPPVVKVIGSTSVVKSAPGYLQTQPINLEAISRSLTTTVALQMPEGLTVISPARPYVTASLTIEAVQSGLTLGVTPTIRGLAAEMTTTLGVEKVIVILTGPLTVMEGLKPSDVQLKVDLTGLLPGNYSLIPVITVPDGVVIESVIPEAVPVKIDRYIATPAPYR